MKDIKKWLTVIKDEEVSFIEKNAKTLLESPSEKTDRSILETINIKEEKKTPVLKKPSYILRYGIAAAILLIPLLSLLFILFNQNKPPGLVVVSTSGRAFMKSDGMEKELHIDSKLKKEDTIITEDNSTCVLQLAQNQLIKITGASSMTLKQLHANEITIFLQYGRILVRTEGMTEKRISRVATPNTLIQYGSSLLVEYIHNTTYVALYKGKAVIKPKVWEEKKEALLIGPGESIEIREGESPVRTDIPKSINELIASFHGMTILKNPEESSRLQVTTNADHVILKINGVKVDEFDKSIILSLEPGTHRIELEKKGYGTAAEDIILLPGKTLSLSIPLKKADENVNRIVSYRKIHTYTNPDDAVYNNILGFGVSGEYIVAVTQTSLICFSSGGSLLWEKTYGISKGTIFDSLPHIDGHNLYISSNFKMVILNTDNGRQRIIDAPGIISDGYKPVLYREKLFLPYPDGIYLFDVRNNTIEQSPIIKFHGPTTPLVTQGGIFVCSYLSPEIAHFDITGRLIHRYSLQRMSICPPVICNGNIITCDTAGNIYKLDPSLKLKASISIPGSVVSLTSGDGEMLYALASDGNLHAIDITTFTVKKKITLDKKSDSSIYFFKSPILIGKSIYIGTDGGTIVIINSRSATVEEEIKVSKAAISCSLSQTDDRFFVGTTVGEIFLLQ